MYLRDWCLERIQPEQSATPTPTPTTAAVDMYVIQIESDDLEAIEADEEEVVYSRGPPLRLPKLKQD